MRFSPRSRKVDIRHSVQAVIQSLHGNVLGKSAYIPLTLVVTTMRRHWSSALLDEPELL